MSKKLNYNIKLKTTLDLDHSVDGDIATFTAGENLAFGDFCYLKSDGKMWKSDASAIGTMVARTMAIGTILADAEGEFLLKGVARDDSWAWATLGSSLFLSETTAELTLTAPSTSAAIVQMAGWVISATTIYFNPEHSYITIP